MSNDAKVDNRPYWQKLRDIKLGRVVTDESARKARKDELTKWFEVQASMSPGRCENCNDRLASTIAFHPRAHICHIVPKTTEGGCPSVATHPLNRWFGCKRCHDAYDNESPDVVATMAVIPVCRERLQKFYPEIAASEVRRVPAFLLPGTTSGAQVSDTPPEIQVEKTPQIKKVQPRKIKKANQPKNTVNDGNKKRSPKRGAGGKFV